MSVDFLLCSNSSNSSPLKLADCLDLTEPSRGVSSSSAELISIPAGEQLEAKKIFVARAGLLIADQQNQRSSTSREEEKKTTRFMTTGCAFYNEFIDQPLEEKQPREQENMAESSVK